MIDSQLFVNILLALNVGKLSWDLAVQLQFICYALGFLFLLSAVDGFNCRHDKTNRQWHGSAWWGKVNQISVNQWHFPRDEIRQSASAAILPAFFVRPIGESEPNFRESMALSPGTRLGNRFCGHSACIPRPSYRGKWTKFPRICGTFPSKILILPPFSPFFPGKWTILPRIWGTFPPEMLILPRKYCF